MTTSTPSLRELEAFRETLWSGSATRAADRLGISQPAISRAIAQLEARIGVVLFRREDGRLRPTPDALALNEELTPVFDGLKNLQSFSTRKRLPEGGRLRVAIPPSFGTAFIHQQIALFADLYPKTRIHHELCTSSEATRMILSGEADVGLTTSPISHEGIRYELLIENNAVCIMPRDHPLTQYSSITPRELDGQRFVAISRVHSSRYIVDRVFEKAGCAPDIALETTAFLSACDFVAAGMGVAIINPFPILDWYSDMIVARPFTPEIVYRISAMLSATPETDWAGQAFVRQLKRNTISTTKTPTVPEENCQRILP